LNGWEPREFTEYVYEGDRLVSTVTTKEPEFTPTERAKLLAYVAYRNGIGQYGENIEDAMSPEADPKNKRAKYRYVATVAMNAAAEAIDRAKAEYEKARPDDPQYGYRWSAVRVKNDVPQQ